MFRHIFIYPLPSMSYSHKSYTTTIIPYLYHFYNHPVTLLLPLSLPCTPITFIILNLGWIYCVAVFFVSVYFWVFLHTPEHLLSYYSPQCVSDVYMLPLPLLLCIFIEALSLIIILSILTLPPSPYSFHCNLLYITPSLPSPHQNNPFVVLFLKFTSFLFTPLPLFLLIFGICVFDLQHPPTRVNIALQYQILTY